MVIDKRRGSIKRTGLYGVRFVPLRTGDSDVTDNDGAGE
jgi:hypothetical protein